MYKRQRSTRTQEHYHPLNFIPLKVRYFLKIDYNDSKELILWGAGKKGKLIARALIDKNIDFTWVTENDKKIGKDIYGIVPVSAQGINTSNIQVVIAVSNAEDVNEIISRLSTKAYYRFF